MLKCPLCRKHEVSWRQSMARPGKKERVSVSRERGLELFAQMREQLAV